MIETKDTTVIKPQIEGLDEFKEKLQALLAAIEELNKCKIAIKIE